MKKILYTDFALMAALGILLGGCWEEIGTQTLSSGDGETSEPVCDVEFTFLYTAGEETHIIYHSLSDTGSTLVKLKKLAEKGDVNGVPFDSACLDANEKQKHGVTLENDMRLMVEVWWGKQCSPDNLLQPCYRNGAVIHVTHTPAGP